MSLVVTRNVQWLLVQWRRAVDLGAPARNYRIEKSCDSPGLKIVLETISNIRHGQFLAITPAHDDADLIIIKKQTNRVV